MNILPINTGNESLSIKVWMKKLSWALPLLFLIKGLLWLAIPVI